MSVKLSPSTCGTSQKSSAKVSAPKVDTGDTSLSTFLSGLLAGSCVCVPVPPVDALWGEPPDNVCGDAWWGEPPP